MSKITAYDSIGKDLEVLDLDTGEFLNRVEWVDIETNEYNVYLTREEARVKGIYSINFPTEIRKGNIVLVYKGE